MATKKTTVKKTVVKKTTAKKTSTSAAKPKAKKTATVKPIEKPALCISYALGDTEPVKPVPHPQPPKHHIPLDSANPLATAKAIIEAGDFSTKNIKFVLTTIMRELAIVKAR